MLLRGTVETVALPAGIEKVDVIVSEWMGYALLYESMLPSVLFARDRHLAAGGAMLPSSCTMLVSASSHDKLAFWDDVYGFDYAHLADVDRKEASVELVPPETLLSAAAPFRVVDTTSAADAELDFTAPFELAATAEGTLRCFVVHFDTDFAPAGGVSSSFTTAASATPPLEADGALPQASARAAARRRDHGHRRLRAPLGVQARVRLLGELRRQRRRDERAAVHDAVARARETVQRVYKAATALPTRYSPGRGACRAT